jgi:hypothetical protein
VAGAAPNRRSIHAVIIAGMIRALIGMLFAVAVSTPAWAQPTEMLKIVTVRGGFTDAVFQHTDYILEDRRRQESPGIGGEPLARIVRCDRGESSFLSLESHRYSTAPLSTSRMRPDDELAVNAGEKPVLRVEITTVDTGQRRSFFGYIARHVITTQRETPPDAKPAQTTELRKDGWYIDLNTHLSCPDDVFFEGMEGTRDEAISGHQIFGNIYRPVFIHIGPRETGYAVEEHRTYRRHVPQPDGSSRLDVSTWSKRVTALAFEPYDPALFEIPRGYCEPLPRLQATPTFTRRLWHAWTAIKHLGLNCVW